MKRYLLVAILSIAALPIFGQNYPTYSENYSDKRYLFTSEEIADADVAYTNTVLEYRKTLRPNDKRYIEALNNLYMARYYYPIVNANVAFSSLVYNFKTEEYRYLFSSDTESLHSFRDDYWSMHVFSRAIFIWNELLARCDLTTEEYKDLCDTPMFPLPDVKEDSVDHPYLGTALEGMYHVSIYAPLEFAILCSLDMQIVRRFYQNEPNANNLLWLQERTDFLEMATLYCYGVQTAAKKSNWHQAKVLRQITDMLRDNLHFLAQCYQSDGGEMKERSIRNLLTCISYDMARNDKKNAKRNLETCIRQAREDSISIPLRIALFDKRAEFSLFCNDYDSAFYYAEMAYDIANAFSNDKNGFDVDNIHLLEQLQNVTLIAALRKQYRTAAITITAITAAELKHRDIWSLYEEPAETTVSSFEWTRRWYKSWILANEAKWNKDGQYDEKVTEDLAIPHPFCQYGWMPLDFFDLNKKYRQFPVFFDYEKKWLQRLNKDLRKRKDVTYSKEDIENEKMWRARLFPDL